MYLSFLPPATLWSYTTPTVTEHPGPLWSQCVVSGAVHDTSGPVQRGGETRREGRDPYHSTLLRTLRDRTNRVVTDRPQRWQTLPTRPQWPGGHTGPSLAEWDRDTDHPRSPGEVRQPWVDTLCLPVHGESSLGLCRVEMVRDRSRTPRRHVTLCSSRCGL